MALLSDILFGTQPTTTPTATPDGLDQYANAISRIESGGRYDLLGPVTRSGDRAYGRYQVMGRNIPEWTEAAGLGRMTPAEFVASPEAQDAVFQHRFGQYVQKYGPEGAAAAWFAGEGGMHNANARDAVGTSVADYVRRFRQGMGGAPVASGAPSSAPAPAAAAAPAAAPARSGGLLAGLFEGTPVEGLLNRAAAPAQQQPAGVDPATAARAAAAALTPDVQMQLGGVPPPQLDLTRLRALLQSRGALGTTTGA
jgi:hypothetical protein